MLIIPPYTQCVQKCHQRSFNNGYPNKKTRFKRALGNFYRLFLSSQIFYILISLEPLSTKVAEFSLPVSQIDYFQPHPKDSPTKVNQTWKPCSTDVTLTSAIAPPPQDSVGATQPGVPVGSTLCLHIIENVAKRFQICQQR